MGLSSFIKALPGDVIEHRSFMSPYIPHGNEPISSMVRAPSSGSSIADPSKLKPGDRVNHPAFGTGVIAKFLGENRVEVIFKDRGIKLLHLGYTSLEKIY